jgi:hypothetical protein
MTTPDYKQLCVELLSALEDEASNWNLDPADHPLVDRARAALAAEPEPPADKEVAEFIAQLKRYAEEGTPLRLMPFIVARAADLLERLAVTEMVGPVPVSARLPGPEDCDEKGQVWAWRLFDPEDDDNGDFWALIPSKWLDTRLWSHWLPATALAEPAPSSPAGAAE